jgi:RND family efflux transporter MFP subunit
MLVVLDARDLEAGYRQAEAARNEARSAIPEADNGMAAANANLELAKVTFGRMKDLFDKRSISNQEFDEAAAKLKVAQAGYEMAAARRSQLNSKIAQADQALRSAEVMRGYAQIAAPFSGLVTAKSVEPGNLAAPGTPLLTIEREGAYRLEASVEESKLAAVRTGQQVTVVLDAIGQRVQGRVAEIVPTVDSASRAFTVKIDMPPMRELRSGLYGRAVFSLGAQPAIAIPPGAVRERGQLTSIFVADSGQAKARFVTLGRRADDRVEVLSGLNPGDKLIYPVPEALADGAAVEVRP